ncbi:MAG: type II secretion system F family protein, partial [Acidimicrobiia bacterium]
MTWILASVAATGVYLLVTPSKRETLAGFLETYLSEVRTGQQARQRSLSVPAGGLMAAAGGAFIGLLAAQGDLFLAGRSRSSFALAVLGTAAGWVLWSMRQTSLKERRARRLRFELPVIADAMSLHIVAGESISATIHAVATETTGVAAEEFAIVIAALESGDGLPDALAEAARTTAHDDAIRLYESLSHAHATGGRLASSLGDLAVDYRSALERDLTSESGKRAIATYGPILALMVPTALIFLIYPTLL